MDNKKLTNFVEIDDTMWTGQHECSRQNTTLQYVMNRARRGSTHNV